MIKRTIVIENASQLSLRQEQMVVRRIDDSEIPSTNPLTLNTQSEPKSAQATSRNTRNLG